LKEATYNLLDRLKALACPDAILALAKRA